MYITDMQIKKNPGNRSKNRGHRAPDYDVAQKVVSFRFPENLILFCRSIGSKRVREILETAQKSSI